MDYFAKLVGIYYPPAFLFLILIVAIILILVQFSVIVSSQNEKIKRLTQEIALLKLEFEQTQKKHTRNKTDD
jgi:Tfp pilus assembly protein PilO